ncbi:cytochrome c [Vibrio sp. ABG19]|uniref:c-type cytochrome n=1 Tax=Vibrio sp. ABG19 TaxID=2817385 RepID=UPI00249F5DF0|nr:cytochrome c [Vibrio sp. ABG19]WGY45318.1 cytochrome c [Vibrio sp. ABG19]
MRLSLFISMCLITLTSFAYDGDPILGQTKIPSCPFCHGKDGIALQGRYPNLRGQDELYLLQAMRAYQNGDRNGPMARMMQIQLQRLNDEDLHDIAAYYASQGG